jgi:hypothetical protein
VRENVVAGGGQDLGEKLPDFVGVVDQHDAHVSLVPRPGRQLHRSWRSLRTGANVAPALRHHARAAGRRLATDGQAATSTDTTQGRREASSASRLDRSVLDRRDRAADLRDRVASPASPSRCWQHVLVPCTAGLAVMSATGWHLGRRIRAVR